MNKRKGKILLKIWADEMEANDLISLCNGINDKHHDEYLSQIGDIILGIFKRGDIIK